jgi:hypothetical protein
MKRFQNLFNRPKAATHYGGYSYKDWWSLMKGIQNYFKSPSFCFHGNCGNVCPTDSDLYGLSCFTRCGCCSYQVSSISVRRVTCCDVLLFYVSFSLLLFLFLLLLLLLFFHTFLSARFLGDASIKLYETL